MASPSHTYQLYSHGRSGELLINGKWKNAPEIAAFLKPKIQHSTFNIDNLNIYGCEFAKGQKGLEAVGYLQKTLGLSVSASTNITGVDGDWNLEVGNAKEVIALNNFKGNLQCGTVVGPVAQTTLPSNSCITGSGSIKVTNTPTSGTYEYTNDGGLTWVSNNLFSGLLPGNYNVKMRLISTKCESANAVVTVASSTLPSGLAATAVNSTSCTTPNGTITINSIAAPTTVLTDYTFSIDGGNTFQNTTSYTGLDVKTYQIYAKSNSTGCVSTVLLQTLDGPGVPTAPTAVAVGNSSCITPNGSITVSPSGQSQYTIDGGLTWQSSNVFTGLVAKTYNFAYISTFGCASTVISQTLTGPASTPTTPTGSGTAPTNCTTPNGTIDVGNETVGQEYSIDGGTTWVPYAATIQFGNLAPGTYTLMTRVPANKYCIASGVITVPAASILAVPTTTSSNPSTCTATDGTITVSPTGQSYYSIDGGNTWQTSNVFSNLGSRIYSVVYKNTSGCISTAFSKTLTTGTLPSDPTASQSGITNTCPATTANLQSIQSAAAANTTNEWHSAMPITTANLVASPSTAAAGTYYLVAKYNSTGCYSSGIIDVLVSINSCTDVNANGIPDAVEPPCLSSTIGITVAPTGINYTAVTHLGGYSPIVTGEYDYNGAKLANVGDTSNDVFSFSSPLNFPIFAFDNIDFHSRSFYDQNGTPIALKIIDVNAYTVISGNTISNSDHGASFGPTSAIGRVQLLGTNITSITIVHTAYIAGKTDGSNISFFQPVCNTVSGNVFHDPNGGNVNNSSGVANAVPSGLIAYLLDVSGNVVAIAAVAADGTYSFSGIAPANYTVEISTATATVGSAAPAISVPSGNNITGDYNGSPNTGNDNTTPAGKSAVFAAGTTAVSNINFGIQQAPVATNQTVAAVGNPGSTTNSATVPFTATDDGNVASITITAFPANATSITINGTKYTSATFPTTGGVTTTAPGGVPTSPIVVDPIDGTVNVPVIFTATDNLGTVSNTATTTLQFVAPSLSGSVFKDANAGIVDGSAYTAGGLNANLLNAAGNVVATVPVDVNGNYSFPSVSAGTYTVQISTNAGTANSPAPAQALPGTYKNTGDAIGSTQGATANGVSESITVSTTNITNINFGIQQPPVATNQTVAAVTNPAGTNNSATVPFTATDADGNVASITITAFPTNATSITINGTTYTSATFPSGGVTTTAPGGVPSTPIVVDPIDGAVNVPISFTATDNAGAVSNSATTTLQFTAAPSLSGSVFNDPNAGNVNNSTGSTNSVPSGMNAYLLDVSGNVVAIATVATDGTYSFPSVAAGTYTVEISTIAATVGSTAPAITVPSGFVVTGDFNGTPNSGIDNTTPAGQSASITVSTSNISNVNFGIQQPPTATTSNKTSVVNTNTQIDLTSSFTGTDQSGGSIVSVIVQFPTSGALSITIGGTTYTASTFASAFPTGATVAVNTTISVLPSSASSTTSIVVPFQTVDNGGAKSALATVTQPLTISANYVTLVDFNAQKEEHDIKIVWTTADEINADKFEVMRSADAKLFENIGTVIAKGNSQSKLYYSLTDQNPIFGINYYRLRSIDMDGSVQLSNIVSVHNEPTLKVGVAPNPFVNKITVSSSESIIKAVLFMPNGSQSSLNLHQLGSNVEIEINQNLSAGVYILSLENLKNQIVKYRLVKE